MQECPQEGPNDELKYVYCSAEKTHATKACEKQKRNRQAQASRHWEVKKSTLLQKRQKPSSRLQKQSEVLDDVGNFP